MLDWMIEDGRIALLAMAVILVELVGARWIARKRVRAFRANAVSGLGLLGALYCALAGLGSAAVAACLALALAAHLFYLSLTRHE